MSYSVKSIRKEFAAKGVFYTPPELEAQDSALRRIKAEIDFSVAVAQIEGWDLYRRLIKKLQNLLDDEKDRMHISGSAA